LPKGSGLLVIPDLDIREIRRYPPAGQMGIRMPRGHFRRPDAGEATEEQSA